MPPIIDQGVHTHACHHAPTLPAGPQGLEPRMATLNFFVLYVEVSGVGKAFSTRSSKTWPKAILCFSSLVSPHKGLGWGLGDDN